MVSLTMSARGVADAGPGDRAPWRARQETARGRPPSPLIGVGYVMAVWWIAFGSGVLQRLAGS
jgi:hypothetical protein